MAISAGDRRGAETNSRDEHPRRYSPHSKILAASHVISQDGARTRMYAEQCKRRAARREHRKLTFSQFVKTIGLRVEAPRASLRFAAEIRRWDGSPRFIAEERFTSAEIACAGAPSGERSGVCSHRADHYADQPGDGHPGR